MRRLLPFLGWIGVLAGGTLGPLFAGQDDTRQTGSRGRQELAGTIGDPFLVPTITSTAATGGALGQAYAYDADGTAEATGVSGAGPLVWSVISAPDEFALDSASGAISWTPALAGNVAIAIEARNSAGADRQDFVVVVAPLALPSTISRANGSSITYCPPERLASGGPRSEQHLNVFLPPGTTPLAGWPVLVATSVGGGFPSPPLSQLRSFDTSALFHELVEAGVAVVHYGNTSVGFGGGMFFPPGHPSGRYESFHRNDDNPYKEAEWAVQWVKTQSTFALDTSNICVRGSSQGAMISMWAAMGPERARATGSAQVRASTRVKGVLAFHPPSWIWAFDQSSALGSRIIMQFERQSSPGSPASALSQVAESLQRAASAIGFAFESAEARAHNRTQPICLIFADPVKRVGGQPATFALDFDGFPVLHDTLGQPFIHDGWFGYMLYRMLLDLSPEAAAFHGQHSVFAIRSASALGPPLDIHTATFVGETLGSNAADIALAWALQVFGTRFD